MLFLLCLSSISLTFCAILFTFLASFSFYWLFSGPLIFSSAFYSILLRSSLTCKRTVFFFHFFFPLSSTNSFYFFLLFCFLLLVFEFLIQGGFLKYYQIIICVYLILFRVLSYIYIVLLHDCFSGIVLPHLIYMEFSFLVFFFFPPELCMNQVIVHFCRIVCFTGSLA